MIKLKINNNYYRDNNNNILQFNKVIKINNSIICFLGGREYSRFDEINDFSMFKLEGGEFTLEKTKEEILEEKVKLLTENLAQEKINNMKKDALSVNLTKEVAILKIEVMNLKKGGNE